MQVFVENWKKAGGENKPMILKLQVSYHPEKDKAKELAFDQWKTNIFESDLLAELGNPKQFEQAAAYVRPEDLADHVYMGSDPDLFIETIRSYQKLGFSKISIHNVNRNQKEFIDFFGQYILPKVKKTPS
ncbi:hypothetical protein [Litoribacter populi]|uniref:hypothetical protein n=1 Tax=Litoribacter populi TaxID=2598460 RepID=UPI001F31C5DB